MPVSTPPAFKPACPPIPLGAAGTVLTSNGLTASTPPTFQPAGSGSGGIGAEISYAPPSGTIDPSITGFTAGLGTSGTGRIKVTLSANTSFEGLPAGVDGQQLFLIIVSGAFVLTLLHLDGATLQSQIFASNDFAYALHDTAQLFYDGSLSSWVLVA